jgi:hypothetical protein
MNNGGAAPPANQAPPAPPANPLVFPNVPGHVPGQHVPQLNLNQLQAIVQGLQNPNPHPAPGQPGFLAWAEAQLAALGANQVPPAPPANPIVWPPLPPVGLPAGGGGGGAAPPPANNLQPPPPIQAQQAIGNAIPQPGGLVIQIPQLPFNFNFNADPNMMAPLANQAPVNGQVPNFQGHPMQMNNHVNMQHAPGAIPMNVENNLPQNPLVFPNVPGHVPGQPAPELNLNQIQAQLNALGGRRRRHHRSRRGRSRRARSRRGRSSQPRRSRR